jgi:hypothetical protein
VSRLPIAAQGVRRIDGIVRPITDRRDRERQQRPFPPVGESSESEQPDEETPQREPDDPEDTEEEEEHHIDVHVLGLILPTGQTLPGLESSPNPH